MEHERPHHHVGRRLRLMMLALEDVITGNAYSTEYGVFSSYSLKHRVLWLLRRIKDVHDEVNQRLSAPPSPQPLPPSPQPCRTLRAPVRLGLRRRVLPSCASPFTAEHVHTRRVRGRGSTARRRHCRATDPAVAARREQLTTTIIPIQAAARAFCARRHLHRTSTVFTCARNGAMSPISTLLGLQPRHTLSATAPEFVPQRRNAYYGYEYARR